MRTGHAVNQGGTAGGISRIYIFFPMQNSSLTEIILVSVKDFFYLFLPEDQNRRARCACGTFA